MSVDAQCVARVLAGDTEAFKSLVERHQSRLIGVLMRIVCDPVVAEEVAHDAFVKAFCRLSSWRGEAAFGTWLVQIGINLARDRQRHQSRVHDLGIISLDALRQGRSEPCDPPDLRTFANPDAELDGRRKWEYFEEALASLPPAFREVVTLRHLEDLAYDEIARMTGDSVGTLKVRNHRARQLLRDRMKKMGVSLGLGTAPGQPNLRLEKEGRRWTP